MFIQATAIGLLRRPLACVVLFLLSGGPVAAAHAPMLPQVDRGETEIAGWLVSEKLDGVRGYWDGKGLWSKNGQRFSPPPAFIAGLPDFPLEGELWGGRGTFARTALIVAQGEPHDGWLQLRFAVFDLPHAPGDFSQRIETGRAWFSNNPSPYAFVIEQHPLAERAQLQEMLQRVLAGGGEGLIVCNPLALYTAGRSAEILKVKEYQDGEAKVIAHLPGQGENAGRLGALLVERSDGLRFRIGSGFTLEERRAPPPVGALITYKFYGNYPSGIPRFPAFLRLRLDQGL